MSSLKIYAINAVYSILEMWVVNVFFCCFSVQNLKIHVESAFKIPVDKQVLLISGGEHLRPDDRVCSYPAGTDTNPIFLFSKYLIERDQPPAASVDYGSEHGKIFGFSIAR